MADDAAREMVFGASREDAEPLGGLLGRAVPITVLDAHGWIRDASARWCEVTGCSRGDVVGRHWTWFISGDGGDAVKQARLAASVPGRSCLVRVVSPTGMPQWLQAHPVPLVDDPGAPAWWLVVWVEATEREPPSEAPDSDDGWLKAVFAHTPASVSVLEPDGSLRSTTAKLDEVASLLGLPTSNVWERLITAVHPEDRETAQKGVTALMAPGQSSRSTLNEIRFVLADGTMRRVQTSWVNLVDEPSVHGLVLVSVDVTSRREAGHESSSASSRLLPLIADLPLGVHMTDEDGRVIAVNRAFLVTLGIGGEPEDLIGSDMNLDRGVIVQLLGSTDAGAQRVARILADCERVTMELVVLAGERTVAVSCYPRDVDGAYRGCTWLVRDVTGRLEVAQREPVPGGEGRQDAGADARATTRDYVAANLVAAVSHELRSPLAAILSFSQLLRSGLGSDTAAEQAQYLEVMERNVDRLLRLVNDLLVLQRLGSSSPGITIKPVDLPELVQLAVSSIRPVAAAKHIAIVVQTSPGPLIAGDVDRLGQVLDNVLSNAVKFTPEGGQVVIAARPEADGWLLEVTDNGIGVPAGEEDRVFDRFFRASNAHQESAAGSGLGLAIVSRVAELHRGTATVRSGEGLGTAVTVTLRGVVDGALLSAPGRRRS